MLEHKMIKCIYCDLETIEKLIETPVPIKDKVFKVTSEAFVCPKCGMDYSTTEQMDKFRNLARKQYIEEEKYYDI